MGLVQSMYLFLEQSFPPKTKFMAEDIPDLTGKVTIVTGGNTGVGYETAKALLEHNAKVYVAARSPEKASTAIKKLQQDTGKVAEFLHVDLASLKSVKAAAEEFNSKEKELHVLFNNAGIMHPPLEQLTEDGYDLQFGTNVLGHYYLTMLVMPALLAGTKTSGDGHARVVNTSSSGHMFYGINFNSFRDGSARRKMRSSRLYFQSKTGNIVFALELQRRYAAEGIVSTSLNPGNLRSGLFHNFGKAVETVIWYFTHPVEYGALTQLYAGTSPEGKNFGGQYLIPWARVGTPMPNTQDPAIGKELWTWLEEQTNAI